MVCAFHTLKDLLKLLALKAADGALGDEGFAARLRKVANRRYQGEELREALNQVVSTHSEEIRQLR